MMSRGLSSSPWRLSLAAGKRVDLLAHGGNARGELAQQRPGPHFHSHFVERPGRHFMPEEEIGHDVEIFAQREILEDGGDAHVQRLGGAVERHLLAAEFDRA
jgi:hypothetical protein